MEKKVPVCKRCIYMKLGRAANVTKQNMYRGGPRSGCLCTHPRARETFERVCPRSHRMAGFIGYTPMGGYLPTIKTSPRWCPLRSENKWRPLRPDAKEE